MACRHPQGHVHDSRVGMCTVRWGGACAGVLCGGNTAQARGRCEACLVDVLGRVGRDFRLEGAVPVAQVHSAPDVAVDVLQQLKRSPEAATELQHPCNGCGWP